jgi:hypothetical protein
MNPREREALRTQKALVAHFQRASYVTAKTIHQIVYDMILHQVFATCIEAGARKPAMDGNCACHEDAVGEEVLREFEAKELLDASLACRAPVAPIWLSALVPPVLPLSSHVMAVDQRLPLPLVPLSAQASGF